MSDPHKSAPEKFRHMVNSKEAFEEAVTRLTEWIEEWSTKPAPTRKESHRPNPTFPMPWGQGDSLDHR